MAQNTTLTTANIEYGYKNSEWEGFGYLGGRRNALDSSDAENPARPDLVAAADEKALAEANRLSLTGQEFFDWMNSKDGRYYADCMFGSNGRHAELYLPGKRQH